MNPETIRSFLSNPSALSPTVGSADEAIWLRSVELIQVASGGLRPKQVDALRGFAKHRTSLLLGPPGTGKTTVLAWMIAGYVKARRDANQPCRVMVTAFTREAIVNVLQSVRSRCASLGLQVEVTFAGRAGDVGTSDVPELNLSDVGSALQQDICVVGMTTWSGMKMLRTGCYGGPKADTAEVFDIVCLDEASQMKVAQGLTALAPLKNGGRIVVAGDDRQLPPIGSVEEWALDERRLGGSLYEFLANSEVPQFALNETFRLNRVLAEAPSSYFYDGEYVSAVPEGRLSLAPQWQDGLPGWMRLAIDPENPVCILLHDGPSAATRSEFEAALVSDIVSKLAPAMRRRDGSDWGDKLWSDGLAVVTPHRAQNAAIRSRLAPSHPSAVVDTVDRIQGRERDAILMSYSVSDTEFAKREAEFLFSAQRFNVAITRPRHKLILVVARSLLSVLPADEDVFDSVRILREYVYGSTAVEQFEHFGMGFGVRVEVRVRRFDDSAPLITASPPPRPPAEPPPTMTAELKELDEMLRKIAGEGDYGCARSFDVDRRLLRKIPVSDYRKLFLLGRIVLVDTTSSTGSPYWQLFPVDDALVPFEMSHAALEANGAAIFHQLRSGLGRGALYKGGKARRGFRDRFVWCDPAGRDLLMPLLRSMETEGLLRLGMNDKGKETVEWFDAVAAVAPAPTSLVTDGDFELLNALEDAEIERMNLGVFDGWFDQVGMQKLARTLAGVPSSLRETLGAIERLTEHGHVLSSDGRIRSRMAELARELRYVKQRFDVGDEDRRPFVVRSLKVQAKTRTRPRPTLELQKAVDELAAGWARHPDAIKAIRALVPAMRRGFSLPSGKSPLLSSFQERSLTALCNAWVEPSGPLSMVITADTGAGKTEAAALPVMFGAALDRLRGIEGTRTTFVYPRIRLAVNQAARLVKYVREYAKELDVPTLTVGMQSTPVPSDWAWLRKDFEKQRAADSKYQNPAGWEPLENGSWRFPFFGCPESACDGRLTLTPGSRGSAEDTLSCESCGWSFAGWVGTKKGLQAKPPALLLMVTESLHQWMSNPAAGSIFGDSRPFSPPRALLADEIHLYGHTHGAMVGWTLQRALGRSRLNGEKNPIAIGMSATIGEPRDTWGRLIGMDAQRVEHVQPAEGDRVLNPRGREYFYFLQPEVESRGKDIAGTSTTIQSLMLLAHGMRRRRAPEGGFRGVVFLDSIDKLKRLHSDFWDAEENKNLSKFRTRTFGPHPIDAHKLQDRCCGEPTSCSRFQKGECWWFAANDVQQVAARGGHLQPGDSLVVASKPVFSGTGGNVESMIDGSDLVFATSSLEVGYDDPEMALVYQQYAPANLASFVQRKGRGGRGSNDRPLTGVTLSIYSPRDSYFFQDPRRMLEGGDFRVPLNLDNVFVRKGQVLSLILDVVARAKTQGGRIPPELSEQLLAEADAQVRAVFGEGIYASLEVKNLNELWTRELAEARSPLAQGESPREWAEKLPHVVRALFEPPNAASVEVRRPGGAEPKREDVSLGLAEAAPGRITRRWEPSTANWLPIQGPRAHWLSDSVDNCALRSIVPKGSASTLDEHIPAEVRAFFKAGIEADYSRPVRIAVEEAGTFRGTQWNPLWGWDEANRKAVRLGSAPKGTKPIFHKTNSSLVGFVVVVPEECQPGHIAVDELAPLTSKGLQTHLLKKGNPKSGLRVAHLFWGAESEVILDTIKKERVHHLQVFSPGADKPARLVGYGMRPEGIRLPLESKRIDAFIEAEVAELKKDEARSRWHRGQFLRFAVMVQSTTAGLSFYEGRQLADLAIAAAALKDVRKEMDDAVKGTNGPRLAAALKRARDERLRFNPLLTTQRVDRVLARLTETPVVKSLKGAFERVKDDAAFAGYLRSALLQALLVRLQALFVIHGLADERRVLGHARLPVQFGTNADDLLTVCERAGGGDGTTRAFLSKAPEVMANWISEGLVSCPNASTDRLLASVLARTSDHARWRALDPRDVKGVQDLAEELKVDLSKDQAAFQVVLRNLFESSEVHGHRFDTWALLLEIQAARRVVATDLGREPSEWELVSAAVAMAQSKDAQTPVLSALLAAFQSETDVPNEESLSPDGRLSELVFRLGTRLCIDGCQACVHSGSDLMPNELAQAASSRMLLERFGSFIK